MRDYILCASASLIYFEYKWLYTLQFSDNEHLAGLDIQHIS